MKELISDDFNTMTKIEEQELLNDSNLSKDEKNEQLVRNNVRLVSSIARKYTHNGEFEDLMQEGIVGLHIAADRFDKDRNIKFCTFAYWYALKQITMYLNKENRAFGTMRNKSVQSFDYTTKDGEKFDRLENEVDDERLTDDNIVYGEVLENEKSELFTTVSNIMDITLDTREKEVIKQRYLCDKKATLKAIGNTMGVSHSLIKMIETKAIKKLHSQMKRQGYSNCDAFIKIGEAHV